MNSRFSAQYSRPQFSRTKILAAAITVVVMFAAGPARSQDLAGRPDSQGAGPQGAAPSDQSAPRLASADTSVLGNWNGTTLASCSVSLLPDRCNAQQKVSITLLQGENSKLTGFYKCAYGTQNCSNMDETGKVVDASVNGQRLTLRVMTPSGHSMIFTGRVSGNKINGGYTTYTGGTLLERGTWLAQRSY
jgi:hypothetical protein